MIKISKIALIVFLLFAVALVFLSGIRVYAAGTACQQQGGQCTSSTICGNPNNCPYCAKSDCGPNTSCCLNSPPVSGGITCTCKNDNISYTCTNGGNGTCAQGYICPSGYTTSIGNQCQSAGIVTPPSGSPPGANSGNPCANINCGPGTYCGGQCGAVGDPGTLYTCDANKNTKSVQACGCRYCPIGADVCTSGPNTGVCISDACQNQGGTCYDKSSAPPNVTPVPNAVCEDSQYKIQPPNIGCFTSGNNSTFGTPCGGGSGICRPTIAGCSKYGEVQVSSSNPNSKDCNGDLSNYVCCVSQNPANGYTPQTACESGGAGTCEVKTNGLEQCSGSGEMPVGTVTDTASCIGQGIDPSQIASGNVECCVPNGPSNSTTYSCKSKKPDSPEIVTSEGGSTNYSCTTVGTNDICDPSKNGSTNWQDLCIPGSQNSTTCDKCTGIGCQANTYYCTPNSCTQANKILYVASGNQYSVISNFQCFQGQTCFDNGVGIVSNNNGNDDPTAKMCIGDAVVDCAPASGGKCRASCPAGHNLYGGDPACSVNQKNRVCCDQ